ncbi:C40 family peptidase [Microvirga pudoricolor]|uniref:C40 family peptidase n=1 Tax=Microvirga pudoricolor TaxID=2778729 RepID=UPI00195141DF|nr:NlpC/P60 family protein [Microvirga pudoricolor]MBM6596182.1 C40 family peptidase [Microvirga pudoricolor]
MTFDRRITPSRPDLADERLRGQVEAERFTTGTAKRVLSSFAPVHRHPSREAPLDTQAIRGEPVVVYDEHEGWAWVQLQTDGYMGYVPSMALGDPGPAPTHRVRTTRSFIYPGPNIKLPHVDHLTMNSLVAVARVDGHFAELADGGFIFAAHLAEREAVETDYVSVAERFLHVPYLWGGKTSLGIDCSGLAQTALAAAGIGAPRDSDMQEQQLGEPLDLRSDLGGLRRGDLVFWKGHVGLMMDETHLLHATGYTMTVMIEPLSVADERIRRTDSKPITSVRRLAPSGS